MSTPLYQETLLDYLHAVRNDARNALQLQYNQIFIQWEQILTVPPWVGALISQDLGNGTMVMFDDGFPRVLDYSELGNRPTTVYGLGLTDGVSMDDVLELLGTKLDYPNGTAAQYIRGDGTIQTLSYSALSGIPSTFTPASHTHAASDITSGTFAEGRIPSLAISKTTGLQPALDAKAASATTLAGYGITDAYPLSGNPSSFINQAGARSAVSLTTTGTSGAATYNSSTGVINVPQYAPPARSFATPSRGLVSATNATGFQISATRDALVAYAGQIQTTSTIGGPSSGSVFLEIADTNSTTPGDWTELVSQTCSNTITLAIVLNQVDGEPWMLNAVIPAGKYVRIRTTSSGTVSHSINAKQQEVLL